ncbi:MAG: hypothetical protein AB3X44_19225 [Leptothrix sp. (in: b-proteobacteria)]
MTLRFNLNADAVLRRARAVCAVFTVLVGMTACGGGGSGNTAAPPPASDSAGNTSGTGGTSNSGGIAGSRDPAAAPSGQPTSNNLIDAALAAGSITMEQSLLYKMYADYGDPALPAALKGDDVGQIEGTATSEVSAAIADLGGIGMLSATTADALHRFAAPPYIQGSWWHQQHPTAVALSTHGIHRPRAAAAAATSPDCRFWEVQCSTLQDWKVIVGNNVNVWYLTANEATDALQSAFLVLEFDNKIVPKLTDLMGRYPLTTTVTSNRVDVILYDLGVDKDGNASPEGRTSPNIAMQGKEVPVHIYLNRVLSRDGLKVQAAHEYMHAIQYSYAVKANSVNDYYTTQEATATWASHFVYPENKWITTYPKHYLTNKFVSDSYDDKSTPPLFRYGAYIFPLFLEKTLGANVIRAIWEEAISFNTELPAIDAAITLMDPLHQLTFADLWPKFIADCWNQNALNFFTQFDILDHPSLNADESILMSNGFVAVQHPLILPHASMAFYRVNFAANPATRSVTFVNGLTFSFGELSSIFGNMASFTGVSALKRHGASMQVFLKVNGVWLTGQHDLGSVPWSTVCRDDPAGNIDEAIFMYGNGEIDPKAFNYESLQVPAQAPGVLATDIGCRDWTGSVSLSQNTTTSSSVTTETVKITNLRLHSDMPTAVPPPNLVPAPYPINDGDLFPAAYGYIYYVVSGTATWTYDQHAVGGPGCDSSDGSTFSIVGAPNPLHTFTNWTPPDSTAFHGVTLNGLIRNAAPGASLGMGTWRCVAPDGKVTTGTGLASTGLDLTLNQVDPAVKISGGGLTVSGSGMLNGDPTTSGTWVLTGETK